MSLLNQITDEADVDDIELRMGQRRLALIQQIKEALERKGWTQAHLAAEMGKEDSQITRLLSPTSNPTLRTLVEIESALDCELFTVNRNIKFKLSKIPSLGDDIFSQSQEEGRGPAGQDRSLAERVRRGEVAGNYQDVKSQGEHGDFDIGASSNSGQ